MNATTSPLSEADRKALERESWINPATADTFGLYRVTSTEGAELVGRIDNEDYAGVVFPVYGPGEDRPKEYFLRRDHPPLEEHDGKRKPKGKYLAPPGRANRLLFGPGESVDALTDTALPILLVEGVKKTLAAWRFSRHEDVSPRFLVCGISGAWNWRGTIGKTPDATGTRVDVKGVIADIDRITWTAREVFVLCDSDTATNEKVLSARRGLVMELQKRGARVTAPDLPAIDSSDKTGFDDLLAQWGPARVMEWLSEVKEPPPPALIPLDEVTLPDLPIDAFPDALGNMIKAVARATETPLELAAMMGLATVSTCCQRSFIVEGAPGYTEPLCLWTVAALESGNRKTAVLLKMTAPLVDQERDLRAKGEAERAAIDSERLTVEARVKALRSKAATAEDIGDIARLKEELTHLEATMPDAPTIPQLWTQDCTPEKLAVLMANNGEAMALLSDEGGLFDMMAGRYSNGIPNLDLYLQGHARARVRVDRKNGPQVDLSAPTLAIGISPQPSVLRGLTRTAGFRERGLLARFLYALPASRLGYRSLNTIPVPESVAAQYSAMILSLLAIDPIEDDNGRVAPMTLRLSTEAQREWQEFAQVVEGHLRPGGEFEYLKDWAGKLPGAVLRVGGLFHCVTHAYSTPQNHTISFATLTQALTVLTVLSKHTKAVFDLMGADAALEGARKVMQWAQRERKNSFTAHDCYESLRGSYPTMALLDPALKLLVERRQLAPAESFYTGKGRPQSQRYTVHPELTREWI